MDAPPTELAPTAMMDELVDDIRRVQQLCQRHRFSVYYYIDQMYSSPVCGCWPWMA